MSSRAPIGGTQALRDAFTSAKNDPNFGYIQIDIDDVTNEFIVTTTENPSDTAEGVWAVVKSRLEEKKHTYFIVKDPIETDKMVLMHFGPDLSPVKQRMLYASSRATLKSFLGTTNFAEDYYFAQPDECDPKHLVDQRTLHKRIDFRSDAEIDKQAAVRETAPTSVQAQVMKNLPIQVTDTAQNALNAYASGNAKTVFLRLNTETQDIEGEENKAQDVANIVAALPEDQPRYVLFHYRKSDAPDSEMERVFAYYCPESADRKEKFTYSTCKANLLETCEQLNIEFKGKVEITSADDWSPQFLDYHVFPQIHEKEVFDTPSAPGRKPKGKRAKKNIL